MNRFASEDEPRFDEEAQRQILQRALELHVRSSGLMSASDLEKAAQEAGSEPEHVRQAIAEMDQPQSQTLERSSSRLAAEQARRGVSEWMLIATSIVYGALGAGLATDRNQGGEGPIWMLWTGFLILPIVYGLLAKSYRAVLIPSILASLFTIWVVVSKGWIQNHPDHFWMLFIAAGIALAVHWALTTRCGGLIGRRHLSHRPLGGGL